MPTCGNCKAEGQTIEHIKACFTQKNAGTTITAVPAVSGFAKSYKDKRDFQPMATAKADVPDSKYALADDNGPIFYEVRHGKAGSKWADFQFVDRLIGHPGDWLKVPVKGANRMATLNLIGQDPMEAAKRFSREFVVCAVCSSPLSDPISLETGFGPVCIKRF